MQMHNPCNNERNSIRARVTRLWVPCKIRVHDNLGKEGLKMNLEIHKPELVQRVNARIQTGQFHDADELIEKALDALDERVTGAAPTGETGSVILKALQASPYRDIDLTPPRVLLTNVRDVVL